MKYTTTQQCCVAGLELRVGRKGPWESMPVDVPTVIEGIPFRIFVGLDEDYGYYVAHCLETGAVATGRSIDEAETMITSILENDIRVAIERGSIESLLNDPAPLDITVRFYETKAQDPDSVRTASLTISEGPIKRGAQSEFRIVRDTKERAAS